MMDAGHGCTRQALVAALTVALTVALPLARDGARADEVKVKGDVIHGKIAGVKDGAVLLDTPDYGKDQKLVIPFENVEDVKTDGPMQVLHGEDGETVGHVLGLQDGKLLVGTDAATATPVDLATIHSAVPIGGDVSWMDRTRSRFRYWDGSFDLAWGLTQSRIDDTSLLVAFSATRKKNPTRLYFDILGNYGKQKKEEFDEDDSDGDGIRSETRKEETTTQDLLQGRARGEYDLTSRLFVFGSGDAQYDGVQRLSIRGVPKAGLGYKIWETKTDLFQVEAGGAWVYEKFFGGESNDFFAVAFGSFLDTGLWFGSRFTWRMDYLPAVDDWANDYLLRNEAALIIPMLDPLNFKISLIDEYDSTPARKTLVDTVNGVDQQVSVKAADNNKLILAIGLSLVF